MGGVNRLDRLQFDDHFPLDDQMGTKTFLEPLSFFDNGNRNLTLNEKSPHLQFSCQRQFIVSLQQSRTKVLMQVNRAIDDHGSDFVLMHLSVSMDT